MNDTILITGGAGFIGCALAHKLVGQGHSIIAVDNLHPQIHRTQERPEALHPDVELVVADVCSAAFWDGFLANKSPETVVHLAAETGTSQSLRESNRHAMVNVVGTTQMLDGFTRHHAIPRSIVLSSSRAVYGEGKWLAHDGTTFYPDGRSHQQLDRGEWDFSHGGQTAAPLPHRAQVVMPNPSSIYGSTKLTQEHIIKCWCAAMQVSASILRFQNVYGPGQSPFNPYTGIINLFHRTAYAKQPIPVYEDGVIGRDFVYIDDVVDAVVAAINKPADDLRVFDVGSGTATTILAAARMIALLHAAPEPQICGKYRDGDIRWAVADAEPLEVELGVRAKVDFSAEGAKLVGEWLLQKGYME